MSADRVADTPIVPSTIVVDLLMSEREAAGRLKVYYFGRQAGRFERKPGRSRRIAGTECQRVYTGSPGSRGMRIRDALESDAEALASVTGRPEDVVRNMIHDRSVRVAVEAEGDSDTDRDSDTNNDDDETEEVVRGFVAFDVRGDTVHVTDFDGSGSTVERLFEEPRRFARREEMGVEVVVPNDEATNEVIEASGFESAGRGPRFEGRRTTRYRIEFEELDGRKDE